MAGRAVVLAPGALGKPSARTADALVQLSRRFEIAAVVDPDTAGRDAGEVLDGTPRGIPVVATTAQAAATGAKWAIVGDPEDAATIAAPLRRCIAEAITHGLGVVSSLQVSIREDPEFSTLAGKHNVRLVDVRALAESKRRFAGAISEVTAPVVAVLGTDRHAGQRTTAWKLVEAFEALGVRAALVGTTPTSWLQGADQCALVERVVAGCVTGELEHAVHEAWTRTRPGVIVVEGHGALTHPAEPGGLDVIVATRPAAVVLAHAPARRQRDGLPGHRMPALDDELRLIEAVCKHPVAAISVAHDGLTAKTARDWARKLERRFHVPCVDPLWHGPGRLAEGVIQVLQAAPTPAGARRRARSALVRP